MADCATTLKALFPDLEPKVIEEMVNNFENVRRKTGRTLADKVKRQKELVDEGKAFKALRLKNEINDAMKLQRLGDQVQNPRHPSIKEGLLSIFETTEASGLSLDAIRRSNEDLMLSLLHIRLKDKRLLDAAKSGEYDKEVNEVMFSGKPNTGKNRKIVNGLAEVFKDMNERERQLKNAAGASVFKRNDFIHTQYHNGAKLKDAGELKWIQNTYKRLDLEQTFPEFVKDGEVIDAEKIMKTMRDDYRKFVQLHDEINGFSVDKDVNKIVSHNNVIDRLNKGRKYHFKDGAHFFDYNQEFGREGSLLSILTDQYRRSAKSAAMIKVLGSSPQKNLKKIVDRSLSASGLDSAQQLAISNEVMKAFAIANGAGEYGANTRMGKIGQVARQWTILTKLGRAALSAGMDIVPTIMSTRVETGENVLVSSLRSTVQFMASVPPSQRKKVAKEMLLSTDVFLHELRDQLMADGYKPGMLSRMVEGMFTASGVNFVTDVARKANGALAMRDLHSIANAKKLNTEMKNTIARYGFNEAEIGVIKQMGDVVSPKRLLEGIETFGMKESERFDLFQKMHIMIGQRARRGSPMPDARTRRRLYLYNPAGTFKGEAARYFAQFKSTLMKITQDVEFFGRAVSPDGNLNNWQSYKTLSQYLILATGIGMLRNLANEKLKDPSFGMNELSEYMKNRDNWIDGIATGGGLAIYGDLIAPAFKDEAWSRDVQRAGAFFLGPTLTNAVKGFRVMQATAAEPNQKTADYIIEQVPFNNLYFLINLNKTVAEELGNSF